MGILFRVHRKLGISYKREVLIRLEYDNEDIGRYFLDFVIDRKIALEIKTAPTLKQEYLKQVLAYLDSANLKLGIIANFRTNRLKYKRLVNPKVKI